MFCRFCNQLGPSCLDRVCGCYLLCLADGMSSRLFGLGHCIKAADSRCPSCSSGSALSLAGTPGSLSWCSMSRQPSIFCMTETHWASRALAVIAGAWRLHSTCVCFTELGIDAACILRSWVFSALEARTCIASVLGGREAAPPPIAVSPMAHEG